MKRSLKKKLARAKMGKTEIKPPKKIEGTIESLFSDCGTIEIMYDAAVITPEELEFNRHVIRNFNILNEVL